MTSSERNALAGGAEAVGSRARSRRGFTALGRCQLLFRDRNLAGDNQCLIDHCREVQDTVACVWGRASSRLGPADPRRRGPFFHPRSGVRQVFSLFRQLASTASLARHFSGNPKHWYELYPSREVEHTRALIIHYTKQRVRKYALACLVIHVRYCTKCFLN